MRLRCYQCGKSVSTEVADNTIVRALLTCPECMGREAMTMKSFHIILVDGNERDVTGYGIEVRDGTLSIEDVDGNPLVVYAPGAWTLVEIQRKDD